MGDGDSPREAGLPSATSAASNSAASGKSRIDLP